MDFETQTPEIYKKRRLEIDLDELCANVSPILREYMKYCYNLKFDEDPDYEFLQDLLDEEYRSDFKNDNIFDWHTHKKFLLAEAEEK